MKATSNMATGYPEARKFIRSLDRVQLEAAIEEYLEHLQAGIWPKDLTGYTEPDSYVFFVPGESDELWGRRLLAIAFRKGTGGILDQKRLKGIDSPLKSALVNLGLEAVPANDAIGRQKRRVAKQEYLEGKRGSAERTFYVRKAALARAVKDRDNYTCQGCNFRGPDNFNDYGERSIEAHHLNAFGDRTLTEKDKSASAKLEDMVALCANCHRVVHGRSPALSVAELKKLLRKKT